MRISKLLIMFIVLTSAFQAIARKPAVEDFVGVETETYRPTPIGSEVVFNFGNHVIDSRSQTFLETNGLSIGVSLAFLALPFMMWFGLKNVTKETEVVASVEFEAPNYTEAETDHSNVASLEEFRIAEEKDKKAS